MPGSVTTIREAMHAAGELRLAFEAHLLLSEAEVEDHLVGGDRVINIAGVAPAGYTAADERPVASFA